MLYEIKALSAANMATTIEKSIIIFVPGAFHTPFHYFPVVKLLSEAGYRAETVELPSTGKKPGSVTLEADIAAVRTLIENDTELGCDIILVVHSAGGVSGCAAVKGLAKRDHNTGGVARIVAVAGFLFPAGTDLLTGSGGKLSDWYYLKVNCPAFSMQMPR